MRLDSNARPKLPCVQTRDYGEKKVRHISKMPVNIYVKYKDIICFYCKSFSWNNSIYWGASYKMASPDLSGNPAVPRMHRRGQ